MGSAWLGLLGAIVGGLVSLTGTLLTSRFQWRQERTRWNEQRERDLLQRESEKSRDTLTWDRTQEDEQFRWRREQKLKSYMEVMDHLLAASEISANASYVQEGEQRQYAREDEMAIVQELRQGYRWMKSLSVVCGKGVTAKVNEVSSELYFTMQAVTHEGLKPGQMVRRPPEGRPLGGHKLDEWILSEIIDAMSARMSEILRTDLDSN